MPERRMFMLADCKHRVPCGGRDVLKFVVNFISVRTRKEGKGGSPPLDDCDWRSTLMASVSSL